MRVILETDMESDIDDAGALAMLHALADNGECSILAVMHNTSDDYGCSVIDTINTYYGRSDLAIGVYRADDAPSAYLIPKGRYAEEIARRTEFAKTVTSRADCREAVAVYHDVLSAQPDASVTIISVGWTMNLRSLLQAEGGADLVRRKVCRLVLMGGGWDPPDQHHVATMNLAGQHGIPAAYKSGKYIIDHWPTEMVLSGLSVGHRIRTGNGLKQLPGSNPVREIYRIYKTAMGQEDWSHASWDQTAVWYAVRGEGKLFTRCGGGCPEMVLLPNQEERCLRWNTIWRTDRSSPHGYMALAAPEEQIAAAIEALMTQPPKR